MKTFHVDGGDGSICARVQGRRENPAVLFGHTLLTSGELWERQAAALAHQGYYAIRLDMRGHGGSSAAAAFCSVDDLAQDCIAVLDALEIGKVHYIGAGLGATIGMGLAIAHPERLLSLCMSNPVAEASCALSAALETSIAIARREGCGALAASIAGHWFSSAVAYAQPALLQRFAEIAASTSVQGFVACATAMQLVDYLPEVAGIALPCTLIASEHDEGLRIRTTEVKRLIPDAVLELMPGTAYLPNLDQPAAFDAALSRHFARLAQNGRGSRSGHSVRSIRTRAARQHSITQIVGKA